MPGRKKTNRLRKKANTGIDQLIVQDVCTLIDHYSSLDVKETEQLKVIIQRLKVYYDHEERNLYNRKQRNFLQVKLSDLQKEVDGLKLKEILSDLDIKYNQQEELTFANTKIISLIFKREIIEVMLFYLKNRMTDHPEYLWTL